MNELESTTPDVQLEELIREYQQQEPHALITPAECIRFENRPHPKTRSVVVGLKKLKSTLTVLHRTPIESHSTQSNSESWWTQYMQRLCQLMELISSPHLKQISIYNGFGDDGHDGRNHTEHLADILSAIPQKHAANVEWIQLTKGEYTGDLEPLAQILEERFTGLRKVTCHFCCFSGFEQDGPVRLAQAIAGPQLTHLQWDPICYLTQEPRRFLHEEDFARRQLLDSASTILSHSPNLKKFKMFSNIQCTNDDPFTDFCHALNGCKELESLELWDFVRPNHPAVEKFGQALNSLNSLTHLAVHGVPFPKELNANAFLPFCKALGTCERLGSLNISVESTDAFFQQFFPALEHCQNLKLLRLINICDDVVDPLMQLLTLDTCVISEVIFEHWVHAPSKVSIKSLDLLLEALQTRNFTLQSLCLHYTTILNKKSQEKLEMIQHYCHLNKKYPRERILTEVTFSKNDFFRILLLPVSQLDCSAIPPHVSTAYDGDDYDEQVNNLIAHDGNDEQVINVSALSDIFSLLLMNPTLWLS